MSLNVFSTSVCLIWTLARTRTLANYLFINVVTVNISCIKWNDKVTKWSLWYWSLWYYGGRYENIQNFQSLFGLVVFFIIILLQVSEFLNCGYYGRTCENTKKKIQSLHGLVFFSFVIILQVSEFVTLLQVFTPPLYIICFAYFICRTSLCSHDVFLIFMIIGSISEAYFWSYLLFWLIVSVTCWPVIKLWAIH